MIKAYDLKNDKYSLSTEDDVSNLRNLSDNDFLVCPSCKDKVIFVNAKKRIKHFRHEVESDCNFEPETNRHLNMKRIILDKLELDKNCLEVPLGFGTPDILIEKDKIAIEVQHSPLSYEKFIERTENYNENDYYPLWIFDISLIDKYITGEPTNSGDDIIRLPEFLKKAHQLYYGRVYVMEGDKIVPIHFSSLKSWKEEYINYRTNESFRGYYYYLKKERAVRIGGYIYSFNILKTDNNDINIARFYDKKFWGDKDEFHKN